MVDATSLCHDRILVGQRRMARVRLTIDAAAHDAAVRGWGRRLFCLVPDSTKRTIIKT